MRKLGARSWGSQEDGAEVNVAPLLDMVFILLIFFVVTTTFADETGVDVSRPQASTATDLERESLRIAITGDGEVVYDGDRYSVNSVRALVRRERGDRALPVILVADESAPSGVLVDVVDECKLGGASKVSVAADREVSGG